MNRTPLKTFPNLLMAETLAVQLREAGYPVTVQKTNDAGGYAPLTTAEVYLEDASLLDDEEHRERIQDLVDGFPLTSFDDDAIAAMPTAEPEPNGPLISPMGWILIIVVVLVFVLRKPMEGWFRGLEDVFPGGKIELPR